MVIHCYPVSALFRFDTRTSYVPLVSKFPCSIRAKMKLNRTEAVDILALLGLHKPARLVYRKLFGAEGRARRRRLRDFYAPLISPGHLVFDVGANVGVYSEIFCSLGAKVIAIEPTPSCIKELKRWLPAERVNIVEAAAGSANGTAQIHLSTTASHSSMSDDWVQVVNRVAPEIKGNWIGELTVPVVTLDTLSNRYGRPNYVKIDVEGFEEAVLDGMSWQPDLLSFEFHFETPDSTVRCLSKPCISANSMFSLIVGEPRHSESLKWITLDQLMRSVTGQGHDVGFGDILVRRT